MVLYCPPVFTQQYPISIIIYVFFFFFCRCQSCCSCMLSLPWQRKVSAMRKVNKPDNKCYSQKKNNRHSVSPQEKTGLGFTMSFFGRRSRGKTTNPQPQHTLPSHKPNVLPTVWLHNKNNTKPPHHFKTLLFAALHPPWRQVDVTLNNNYKHMFHISAKPLTYITENRFLSCSIFTFTVFFLLLRHFLPTTYSLVFVSHSVFSLLLFSSFFLQRITQLLFAALPWLLFQVISKGWICFCLRFQHQKQRKQITNVITFWFLCCFV